MPTFRAPPDCTPWVIGGLWPAELSDTTDESATLADYLRVDLRRIAEAANENLRAIRRAVMTDPARRSAEVQLIEEARALAIRRVESTMRQLWHIRQDVPTEKRGDRGRSLIRSSGRADMDATQVIAAVKDGVSRGAMDKTRVTPAVTNQEPIDQPGGVRGPGQGADVRPNADDLGVQATNAAKHRLRFDGD